MTMFSQDATKSNAPAPVPEAVAAPAAEAPPAIEGMQVGSGMG